MPFRDRYTGLINRYRDHLPVNDDTPIISLGEGNTPLIRLKNIPRLLGKDVDIYVKYEGLNPTGSFKDRGMTMAVTKAVEEGSNAIICASTGNTSAAAAAYAARAGITAFVIIPEGKIAMGKLAQAMMYGAVIMQIRGNFDQGMQLVKDVAETSPVTVVNSVNPYRLQGQKTAAFEIIEELGRAPDYHCLPVGNAGNISAHWMGYSEYHKSGVVSAAPKMVGYQANGAAPSCVARRCGIRKPWPPPSASAIRSPGTRPGRCGRNPAAGSMNWPTRRSWRRRKCWRRKKACSASRPPPRPSVAPCAIFAPVKSPRAAPWSARSPATVSRTRTPPSSSAARTCKRLAHGHHRGRAGRRARRHR